jgi:hypothetical protein
MSIPRRAAREVYRVLDEEEFLANAGQECLATAVPGAPDRRRRRVAGTAMLLGALTATGAVVVLNELPPIGAATRRLRGGMRSLAANALSPSRAGRTHVWRAHATPPRGTLHRSVGASEAQRPRAGSGTLARHHAAAAQASPSPTDAAIQPATATAVLAATGAVRVARPTRPEFGFER